MALARISMVSSNEQGMSTTRFNGNLVLLNHEDLMYVIHAVKTDVIEYHILDLVEEDMSLTLTKRSVEKVSVMQLVT